MFDVVLLVIAFLCFLYLLAAVLRPEKF